MHERWNPKQCRERTVQLLDEQLFFDLYDTLKSITTEYGEPSPAELWDEAATRWKPLLASKRPQFAVEMLRDELTEIYGERSAFLILIILMYMLVAMFRPTTDSPYREYCQALADATKDHSLLERFWQGVRQTEDEEEQAGRKIGIVASLVAEKGASVDAIESDTIEQCILRLPTFELQHRALNQADELLRGTSWSQRSAVVQEKIFAKAEEQRNRQAVLENDLKRIAEKPSMQIEVKEGGHAQISEQGITNQYPLLPKK